MSVSIKKHTGQHKPSNHNSFAVGSHNVTGMNTTQGGGNLKSKDVEDILYGGHEDGPDVYEKYMGRI